jgi:predicted nucleic acid-binding protein
MRYVLDASVGLCWVVSRPLSPKALRLRDDYRKSIHELIAPSHLPSEIASALTKVERQKLIPVGDARRLIADVLSTPPILYSLDPLFYRAVEISSQTRAGFYDCLYVALAEPPTPVVSGCRAVATARAARPKILAPCPTE